MLHKIYILILFLAPLTLFAQNKDLNLPELGDRVSGVISLEQERILGQGFLEQVYAQAPLIYDPIIQEYIELLVYRLSETSQVEDREFSIVLIDDSLVRGTTCHKIVKMLYEAGAKEVHVKIACPEIKYPDFYGIDTPETEQLLASNKSLDEMCKHIGADSLGFLSLDGLYQSMGYKKGRNNDSPEYTDHCFTGDYPTNLSDYKNEKTQEQLSLLSENESQN